MSAINGEILVEENFDRIFGPESEGLHQLALKNIIVAGQYRSRYDEQDQAELANSIDKENLQNPVLVCEMTAKEAADYLSYTNRVWNAKVDLERFIPNNRGNFYLLAAGHKRTLAMMHIADKQGLKNPATAAFVTREKSILQVMKLQGVENIHKAPIPQDKANLIHQMYLFGMENGIYKSQTEFVQDSPFSAHETYSALRYVVLPEELKNMVDHGHLSYSTAVSLYPLYEAFYERLVFKETPACEIDQKLDDEFMEEVRYFATFFPRMTLPTIQTMLKNRIRELTSGQSQLDLINQEEDMAVRRATPAIAVVRRSAENILHIVENIIEYGGIDGWRADAPVAYRQNTCDAVEFAIKALVMLRNRSRIESDFPGLDELIEETQELFFSLR